MNPITRLRNAKDLTQDEFARLVGRTQATVSKWESGEQMPDTHALRVLAKLGLDVAALLAYKPRRAA